jgi:hypothetical protein
MGIRGEARFDFAHRPELVEGPPRPYVHNLQDAVQVVRHHNERVQSYFRPSALRGVPFRVHDISQRVAVHLSLDDLTEQQLSLMRADCDEIRSRAGVVVSPQSNRTPMVHFRIVFHDSRGRGITPPDGHT